VAKDDSTSIAPGSTMRRNVALDDFDSQKGDRSVGQQSWLDAGKLLNGPRREEPLPLDGLRWAPPMTSSPSKLLHRYWLKFAQSDIDAARLPQIFLLGCGVTAFSPEDALSLIRQHVLRGAEVPKPSSLVADVDVRTLDAGHVIPNMEAPVSRGIWFPMGFGFTRGPL
jgi:hypothetical protein